MSNELFGAALALLGFGGPIAYGFWLMWKHRDTTVMSGKE